MRDQMAQAICEATASGLMFPWASQTESDRDRWRAMADAAIAAQREACKITTVLQLQALPVGTVVVSPHGRPYQHDEYDLWHEPGDEMSGDSRGVDLPAVVVWHPNWRTS